jgi:hypothetical protein
VSRALALAVAGIVVGAAGPLAHAEPEVGWDVKVADRVVVVAGTSDTLSIAIQVDRGKTISKDAGILLDLEPEGGLAVKRRRLGRADAVDPDADSPRFAVPLRTEAAGEYRLKLHLRFWLCGQKACRPVDARRTVAVTSTPPT